MTDHALISVSPSWFNETSTSNPELNSQTCNDNENFRYVAYTVTYSAVFPVAFISNVVALFVLVSTRRKDHHHTVFMMNLAISDFCFSLTLPFRLVYYFRGCQWDFPDWLCRWCVFCFYVNLYTSVLFLTGLSVLRYIAVCRPFKNKRLGSVLWSSLACFAIWIFVACLSVPFLLTGTVERSGKMRCFEPGTSTSWRRLFTLNYLGVLFGFVIPFITILACYGCIIRTLLSSDKLRSARRKELRRSMSLIAVILCAFLLCFLPYHVVRTVHLHAVVSGQPCSIIEVLLKVLVISLCTAASSSCFNPLLYYYATKKFRANIRQAMERHGTMKRNSHKESVSFSKVRPRAVDGGREQTPDLRTASLHGCTGDKR